MDRSWNAPLDFYCERTDAGFWSEPVNALTNAAFLLAAALASVRWRRAGGGDLPSLLLILIIAVVGIGSFLFHTVATRWALYADVIPIQIFILGYFLLVMRRHLGLGPFPAAAATLGFFVLASLLPRYLPGLGGSAGYLAGLLALFAVGGALLAGAGRRAIRDEAGRGLVAAGAVFFVSLMLRTFDGEVCPHLPTGIHPLWHVLNALVLYLLVALAIRTGPAASGCDARPSVASRSLP